MEYGTLREPWIAKSILKNNKVEGLILSDFKSYYKAQVIKTVQYYYKERHLNQWNRIQSPEIKLHICSQIILVRVPRPLNGGKDSLLNDWYWENWISTWKRTKLDLYLTPYTKIQSKWIKNLNIRGRIIKLLQENKGGNFMTLNLTMISWVQKAQATKGKKR